MKKKKKKDREKQHESLADELRAMGHAFIDRVYADQQAAYQRYLATGGTPLSDEEMIVYLERFTEDVNLRLRGILDELLLISTARKGKTPQEQQALLDEMHQRADAEIAQIPKPDLRSIFAKGK